MKILFLAANTTDESSQRRLDLEFREIDDNIDLSDHRDSIRIVPKWAVRKRDLQKSLNRTKPDIVHFTGSGDDNIVVSDDDGSALTLTTQALTQLFRTHKRNMKLVFLNACLSNEQADAIKEEIGCVVFMRSSFAHSDAIKFASAFYAALGYGESLQNAFDQGIVELNLADSEDHDKPLLLHRPEIDPEHLILSKEAITDSLPEKREHSPDDDYKANLLKKIMVRWVKPELDAGMRSKEVIELGLDSRSAMVLDSFSAKRLAASTKIDDVFDKLVPPRRLSIIGEPGAGKTTALLLLTRELIGRYERRTTSALPIYLRLSSSVLKYPAGTVNLISNLLKNAPATEQQQSNPTPLEFAGWLTQEIKKRFQFPERISQQWLDSQKLVLLLDGLDEVSPHQHDSFVDALNAFAIYYPSVDIVLTCRALEYSQLSNRLDKWEEVSLKPLAEDQIRQFFDSLGGKFAQLGLMVLNDQSLSELTRTPLMLQMIATACANNQTIPFNEDLNAARRQILNTYIDGALRRKAYRDDPMKAEPPPEESQLQVRLLTKQRLSWLAKQMNKPGQDPFVLERMQPDMLPSRLLKFCYFALLCLIPFVLYSVVLIFVAHESIGLSTLAPISPLLLVWAIFSARAGRKIEPIETISLSLPTFLPTLQSIRSLCATATIAIASTIAVYFVTYAILIALGPEFLDSAELFKWADVAFVALPIMANRLFRSLRGPVLEVSRKPNQGIRNSVMYSVWLGVLGMIVIPPAFQLLFWCMDLPDPPSIWDARILYYGLVLGSFAAMAPVLQHFLLRAILALSNCVPFNLPRFCDYCCERIIMTDVGGVYKFIHPVVKEHIAGTALKVD